MNSRTPTLRWRIGVLALVGLSACGQAATSGSDDTGSAVEDVSADAAADVVDIASEDATPSPRSAAIRFGLAGVKGVGELGICGVGAAIANAVYNATGVRVREYPITLDKLLDKLPPVA